MKKFISKIGSIFLAIIMVVSISTVSFAADNDAIIDGNNSSYQIELSMDELEQGVTFALIKQADGSLKLEKVNNVSNFKMDIPETKATIQATFHVGVKRTSSTSAYLHWNATGYQLTKVEANVFCESTSILFPKSYFNGKISGYNDLSGRYNTANGTTKSFTIPSDTEKVRIGWKSAYVTTVTQGKMSMASASQAVSI